MFEFIGRWGLSAWQILQAVVRLLLGQRPQDIVVDYVTVMMHKAMDASAKRGKLDTEDLVQLVRKVRSRSAQRPVVAGSAGLNFVGACVDCAVRGCCVLNC